MPSLGGTALKSAGCAAGLAGAVLAWVWLSHPSPSPPAEDLPPARQVLFEDVTEKSGPHFVHDAGLPPGQGRYFAPQIVGSGAAPFDFGGGGLLDLSPFTNGGPHSASTNP